MQVCYGEALKRKSAVSKGFQIAREREAVVSLFIPYYSFLSQLATQTHRKVLKVQLLT